VLFSRGGVMGPSQRGGAMSSTRIKSRRLCLTRTTGGLGLSNYLPPRVTQRSDCSTTRWLNNDLTAAENYAHLNAVRRLNAGIIYQFISCPRFLPRDATLARYMLWPVSASMSMCQCQSEIVNVAKIAELYLQSPR